MKFKNTTIFLVTRGRACITYWAPSTLVSFFRTLADLAPCGPLVVTFEKRAILIQGHIARKCSAWHHGQLLDRRTAFHVERGPGARNCGSIRESCVSVTHGSLTLLAASFLAHFATKGVGPGAKGVSRRAPTAVESELHTLFAKLTGAFLSSLTVCDESIRAIEMILMGII